jgi:hypothetical protein
MGIFEKWVASYTFNINQWALSQSQFANLFEINILQIQQRSYFKTFLTEAAVS